MVILSVKDNPPKKDMVCLVWNEKGWMNAVKARYHHHYDVFVLHDSSYRESITLEVTHYMPIPDFRAKC